MARLRRRWRVVKWAGLVLSLLLICAWAISIRYDLTYNNVVAVQSGDGAIYYASVEFPKLHDDVSWSLHNDRRRHISMPLPSLHLGSLTDVLVPYWVLILLTALPTAFIWWRDRRRIPPHCCQGCGYDLTGNVSGVCPECGNKVGQ